MRRKIIYGCSIILILLGLLYWWFWPRNRLTPENLAKVKIGMNLYEVKQLLGEALDLTNYDAMAFAAHGHGGGLSRIQIYTPKSAFLPRLTIMNVASLDTKDKSFWVEQKRGFYVVFDAQGRITETASFPVESEGGGVWNWLKSQYESWTSPP